MIRSEDERPGIAPRVALDPEVAAALARPEAFPGDSSASARIGSVQTHLSWVFLTGERVYKFRKPVDLGFVCFTDPAERDADCLREVSLNRRLAHSVYLGVAPLRRVGDRLEVGPVSEALAGTAEHCVVMRRLPENRDALSRLEAGTLTASDLDRVASTIARFHLRVGQGKPAPYTSEAWFERCVGPFHACFDAIERQPGVGVLAGLAARTRALANRAESRLVDHFERRRLDGRAVDGHGDLHLQHVWLLEDERDPVIIDCLEFSAALRQIDAASEVAFLAMDLEYRDAAALASRFLSTYAAETDDYGLYRVVDYFTSYRAAVRAKVAAIAAADPGIPKSQRDRSTASAERHLQLSLRRLERQSTGALVLVGGAVGTGKTTVATALSDALGGAVISSDRVRKHLHELRADEPAGPEAYTASARERVYGAVLARAVQVLASGRPAVLDATFGRREQRERALELARDLGVPAYFVEVRCAPETAMERIATRVHEGHSASDAPPELHRASVAGFERVAEWPVAAWAPLRTDSGQWREEIPRVAHRIEELRRSDGHARTPPARAGVAPHG